MKQRIIKCLKEIKSENFDYEENLILGGYLSSFDLLELIVRLENEFVIKIPLQLVVPENFDSVERISELVISCKR